eukprot:366436-Chlamydomonas_euryale.AAC.27
MSGLASGQRPPQGRSAMQMELACRTMHASSLHIDFLERGGQSKSHNKLQLQLQAGKGRTGLAATSLMNGKTVSGRPAGDPWPARRAGRRSCPQRVWCAKLSTTRSVRQGRTILVADQLLGQC